MSGTGQAWDQAHVALLFFLLLFFLLSKVKIILCTVCNFNLFQLLVSLQYILRHKDTMNLIFEEAYSPLEISVNGYCISF